MRLTTSCDKKQRMSMESVLRRVFSSSAANATLQSRLPYVYTAEEINQMRFWRKSMLENPRIVDPIKRAKNFTARRINMQLSEISRVTRKRAIAFPPMKNLHPFEKDVVTLTLGSGTYEQRLQELRKVYAKCHQIGKLHEQKCQDVRTKQEALDCYDLCIEELHACLREQSDTLTKVAKMAKTLRGLPTVDLYRPIFAFVGAPNVGKSSLVKSLSTASPEIANYPFTTRGITMGHLYIEGTPYQIADTPGLIYRSDEERNSIERFALSMIEKTQASIGFVFDPTETSGTSASDQLALRQEVKGRVQDLKPDTKWIDIISKIDHNNVSIEAAVEAMGDAEVVHGVSSETNEGLNELNDCIRSILETPL